MLGHTEQSPLREGREGGGLYMHSLVPTQVLNETKIMNNSSLPGVHVALARLLHARPKTERRGIPRLGPKPRSLILHLRL